MLRIANPVPTIELTGRLFMAPISIQLYTLREECAKDFFGVLRTLAEIGYAGVETAGLHGSSHMMMMDRNNAQVAEVIANWLRDKGLTQEE